MKPIDQRPTTLYRAYDQAGQLIYIGIAVNWPRRWTQHSERSPWFDRVARVEVELHPNRAIALAAEQAAIEAEKPTENIEHTPKDRRPMRWRRGTVSKKGNNYRTDLIDDGLRVDSLVGSFFLGSATRQWQGVVVGEPHPGVYLVETFSWMGGGSTRQYLVRIEEMIEDEWTFYDTAEWMAEAPRPSSWGPEE